MPFNYITGQYEPDQLQQPTQPSLEDWLRMAGFGSNGNVAYTQSQPNPNAAGTSTNGPAGSGYLNGGQVDPVTGRPPGVTPPSNVGGQTGPNGQPYPPGTGPDYTNQPPGNAPSPDVPYTNPGTVLTPQGQQPPAAAANSLGTFSGNTGTDPTKPPDNSGDWFFSGGHWVDRTGQRDATGRYLTDAEKAYWQGFDHARAGAAQSGEQSILQNYLKQSPNPGLPAGNQPSYLPYTTQPTAQTTPPPAAAPAAAPVVPDALDPSWDYSKPGAVPWMVFQKNVFSDANANQNGFAEVQGALDRAKLQEAIDKYGWKSVTGSGNPDPNVVFRNAITMGRQNPAVDYVVVRLMGDDGTTGYGIVAREQSTADQEARGFFAPGSTNPNSPANKARAEAAARAKSYGGNGYGQQGQGSKVVPKPPVGPTASQVAGAKGLGRGSLVTAAGILTADQQAVLNKIKQAELALRQGVGVSGTAQQNALNKLKGIMGAAGQMAQGASVATGPAGTVPAAPLGTPVGTLRGYGTQQEMWNGQQWVLLNPTYNGS